MTNKVYIIENGLDVQGNVTFSGTLIGDGSGLSGAGVSSWNDLTDKPTSLSYFTNNVGFITSYTETDPIYTASSWYSTTNNSSNWNTAYGWGNHASAGYLTSISWSGIIGKPTFADVATSGSYNDLSNKPFIPNLTSQLMNDAGYITSYAETDTLQSITTRGATTTNNVTVADLRTTGNLQIDGNLTVNGTQNIINTTNLAVEDNMIYLNNGSTVTDPDLGFAGNYNDGTYHHAGLFRDASDGKWKFYHQYTPEPGISIDITHASFALADVQANTFIGSLTGNADTVTNGVYTNGSYSDPSWLTSLAYSKLTGTPTLATVATTGSYYDLVDAPAAGVVISDTSPASPVAGTQWWDSSVGRLYIYYNDGNSSQWVDASPSLVGPAGADGADGTTYTTTSNVQLGSLGIGTSASGISGEIRATNNITAYYSSDFRLKENIKPIENALTKLDQIRGVTFDWTEEEIQRRGGEDNYFVRKSDIGVIAQEIEAVIPEAVATRPDGYKAVRYELIIPLLIESLKSQQEQINSLKKQLEEIK